jgi:hypothetical protein
MQIQIQPLIGMLSGIPVTNARMLEEIDPG